jgi:methylthioribulose-1-phosphate dehydratase
VREKRRASDRPSAETAIHAALYRRLPEARAALHGHSIDASLVSMRLPRTAKALRLPAIEMLKGFDLWQQNPKVDLPLFENRLDVGRIALEIDQRFRRTAPAITALMIRGHGATVWGRGLQEAYNRFECLEFILAVAARRGGR